MEIPCAKTQRLTYHGRCRQMRALGGDCFHFVPLPGRRVALAVADASGKGLPAALHRRERPVLSSHCRFVRPRKSGRGGHRGEPSVARMLARRSIRHLILRRLRRKYADAALCQCRPQSAVVIRRGGDVTWLEASAPPVGLFARNRIPGAGGSVVSGGSHRCLHRRHRRSQQHGQAKSGASRVFLRP